MKTPHDNTHSPRHKGRNASHGNGSFDRTTRVVSLAALLGFSAGIAEMLFMSGPFALYFYGLYSPFLQTINGSAQVSWLSQFWISHLTPANLVFASVEWLGIALTVIGLGLFAVHVVYLYWMKFRCKAIATRLLYAVVRHPQYTSLLIAGSGFALLWPRFINLVLLLVMVGAYYALARQEESRMQRRFPAEYRTYAAAKPMFLPGGPGRWLSSRLFFWAPAGVRAPLFILLFAGLVMAGAFAVREASVRDLHIMEVAGAPQARIINYSSSLSVDAVSAIASTVDASDPSVQLVYVMRKREGLRHLLVDSGLKDHNLIDIPKSTFYVMRVKVFCAPVSSGRRVERAEDAFRVGVLRVPVGLYAIQVDDGGVSVTELPLADGTTYAHASAPLI